MSGLVAAGPGLEPGLTDPESAVLPIKLSRNNKAILARRLLACKGLYHMHR